MLSFLSFLFKKRSLSVEELKEKLDSSTPPMLIDVRDESESVEMFIENSVVIPYRKLEEVLTSEPKEREIVLYCSMGARSAGAANLVRRIGFENVYNLKGGLNAWRKKMGAYAGVIT